MHVRNQVCCEMLDETSACEPHHLPQEAHDFLDLLKRECGVPINMVAVGRARDQFVHLGS